MSSTKGFTLVELLIAIAVVGILAVVAIPSYREYVIRGKIPEATSGLAGRRVQAEQWFQDNRTYVGTPACNADTSGKNFDFSCSVGPTATAYTIQAVGKGQMAGFTYTIDQTGARATPSVPAGWTASSTCWVTAKGGAC